jgi:ornithine carbamoyltransferase
MKKDFLALTDLTTDELSALIKRAVDLKAGKDRNACPLIGKNIGLF